MNPETDAICQRQTALEIIGHHLDRLPAGLSTADDIGEVSLGRFSIHSPSRSFLGITPLNEPVSQTVIRPSESK